MDDLKDNGAAGDLSYTYKPSLTGAAWQFELTPHALAWAVGRRSGRVPYGDIARFRMSFRPVSMLRRRYRTEIWAEGTPKLTIASTSWKSLAEQESKDKPYGDFVSELHRRVDAGGAKPLCQVGLNPFMYWPGVAVFVAVLLAIAGLTVRALQMSDHLGTLFLVGFLALFVWQLGTFFRLNMPSRYDVATPPRYLLPGA